jgi:tetratricopeptide (TPR) repeat protein
MRIYVLALALILPLAAPGAWCAAPPPVDKLFGDLRGADTPDDAKPLEAQILASFLRSGSPSIDLLMSRAEAALAAGQKPVAKKLYETVTDIAPRFAEGWHRRALMQQEAGEDSAAMLSLQKAVDLNPRHFEALFQLGEMLEDYGDKPGALKMYRRALALDPHLEGLGRHIDGLSRSVEGQGI